MFFIAGVQPKTITLDQFPRRCPICGTSQAYQKRIDHYISLFFIPLIRVKKGEPALVCDRCQGPVGGERQWSESPPDATRKRCYHCNREVRRSYQYCPHCGQRV